MHRTLRSLLVRMMMHRMLLLHMRRWQARHGLLSHYRDMPMELLVVCHTTHEVTGRRGNLREKGNLRLVQIRLLMVRVPKMRLHKLFTVEPSRWWPMTLSERNTIRPTGVLKQSRWRSDKLASI